ncbi:MAG: beta-1,6-N-acetylglucosaminyltransferase [Solirubrobacteraceae bacterium]
MPSSIVYVILAHKAPAQVVELVRTLASERAWFIIHVDRASPRSIEREIRGGVSALPRVSFLPSVRTPWGGFGIIRATLDALEVAERLDLRYTHVVPLSGQDFPIAAPATIERFLSEHEGRTFLDHRDLPYWPDTNERLHHWHRRGRRFSVRIPTRRAVPPVVAPVRGGSAWSCLARDDVRYVLEIRRRHPEVERYFRRTLLGDELYFQTVVLSRAGADVINDNLRFIRWTEDTHPDVLTVADLDALGQSGKLFARKFDAEADPDVTAEIRRRLLGT